MNKMMTLTLLLGVTATAMANVPDCWNESSPDVLDGKFLARIALVDRDLLPEVVRDFRGEFVVKNGNYIDK